VRVSAAARRTPPVAGCLCALALAVTGCGSEEPGGSGDSGGASAAGAPKAAPSTAAARSGARAAAAQPAQPRAEPAPADLANFSCTRTKGTWSAGGDVSNSAKQPMVYTVTVVTLQGADVAGEESERVLLEGGEATRLELPGISTGTADACIPRVVREAR
jgi:hypothetical protein